LGVSAHQACVTASAGFGLCNSGEFVHLRLHRINPQDSAFIFLLWSVAYDDANLIEFPHNFLYYGNSVGQFIVRLVNNQA
jgi:hypothetical protein